MFYKTIVQNMFKFRGAKRHFQQCFIYIVEVSFICGGQLYLWRSALFVEKTGVPGENH